MSTTNTTSPAAERTAILEAARTDAEARYQAALARFATATIATVDALRDMLASSTEIDFVSRRVDGNGAAEMRFADHLVSELRLCFDHASAIVTSPRDAVVEHARAAAEPRLAELRAL